MSTTRADPFGDDDLGLGDFRPKQPEPRTEVRNVAEQAGFRSREPQSPPQVPAEVPTPLSERREQRRYRTGRNVQLNIKARSEDIDAFYELADRTGLVLGEVFARAVKALEKELSKGSQEASR